SLSEGVADRQAIDAEAVLHVVAPESRAASFERGGDDERIVETERVALLQLQSALVQRRARHHPPERCQDAAEKAARIGGTGPPLQLAGQDGERLLNDLET